MPDDNTEPRWKAEIRAMQAVCNALEPLDPETRSRVLAAVLCMYDQKLAEKVIAMWRRAS